MQTSEQHRDRCSTAYANFMATLEEGGPVMAVEVTCITLLALFATVLADDRESAATVFEAMQAMLDAGGLAGPAPTFTGLNS